MTTPPGGSYPGPDPDDPFSKPPQEGTPSSDATPATPPPPAPTDETAPIQREEVGYWEKQAIEQQQKAQESGQAQPPAPGYTENPTSAQFAPDPNAPPGPPSGQPEETNPWAGYGQPAYPPQQPVYGQPPAYGGQPPAPPGYYGQPGVPTFQQPHPQATTVMVLGLIGLVGGCICYVPALVAPFAWVMGARVKREIRESNGQLGGEGNAQAGFVMGIIGTVVLALAILAVILIVVIAITADTTSTTGTTEF
ncbi:MAG: hypothetical protein JWO46_2216 [Nocardioidaceae bacterium]|nr:hypothetical protein [Nocardioidaceae bacterium]